MFCILLYVLSRSDSVPSRSATCSEKRYVFLIRSVTFRSSSFTFFPIFRQVIQNMYTFRHVPCNSYTKTWKMLFCKDLATKSGQIGRRTRGGYRSYPHPKESDMICVWEKPSWGRANSTFHICCPQLSGVRCGGEKTQALAIGGGEAKQRSFGPILAGPSISLRSDHVPVTFRHVPSIGFTLGFLGMHSHIIVCVLMRSGQPYW